MNETKVSSNSPPTWYKELENYQKKKQLFHHNNLIFLSTIIKL